MYDLFPEHADLREKGQKSSLEWDLGEVRYGARYDLHDVSGSDGWGGARVLEEHRR